jgi:hypothetical protein
MIQNQKMLKFVFALLVFPTAMALAEDNWQFSGDLNLDTIYSSKPSSDVGKLELRVASLKLLAQKPLAQNMKILLRSQFGPDRIQPIGATNQGPLTFSLEEAHLQIDNLFFEKDKVRGGLVSNPWINLINTIWPAQPYTAGGLVQQERLAYTARADVGFDYTYNWSENFQTILTVVNGEGLTRNEVYASKDMGLQLQYQLGNWRFALAGISGRYADFPTATNLKSRVHLLVAYVDEGFSFGIEGFQGIDPVDAITQLQGLGIPIAAGANLTSQGGRLATANGGAGYFYYTWTKYFVFAKGEYLSPILELPIWHWLGMSGFGYGLNDKVSVAFANNHYWYNDDSTYGIAKRETDKWYFSLRALF